MIFDEAGFAGLVCSATACYHVDVDPLRPLLRVLRPLWSHPRWRALRAVLIALHVAAVVSVACPAPVRTMSEAAWQRPAVQEEVVGWTKRLALIGVDLTPKELQVLSTDVQKRWITLRKEVLGPAMTYLRAVGATQGWYMFTGPDKEPQRFVLAFTTATDDGGVAEEPVFELGYSLAHPELIPSGFLDDHRVRRVLFQTSWSKSENTFRLVCSAFDKRLRERRADIVDTICRLTGRPVEHPYNRARVRRDTVAREIAMHRDGSVSEAKEGQPVKRRLPHPKPRQKATP